MLPPWCRSGAPGGRASWRAQATPRPCDPRPRRPPLRRRKTSGFFFVSQTNNSSFHNLKKTRLKTILWASTRRRAAIFEVLSQQQSRKTAEHKKTKLFFVFFSYLASVSVISLVCVWMRQFLPWRDSRLTCSNKKVSSPSISASATTSSGANKALAFNGILVHSQSVQGFNWKTILAANQIKQNNFSGDLRRVEKWIAFFC